MSDFHFLRPSYLYLFIPFAVLALFFLRRKNRESIWSEVCSKDLLPYVVVGSAKKNFISYFGFLASSLLIFALAGPCWDKTELPLIKKQSGLVIALDLSPAMNAADVKPTRLQAAIYKITDLLQARTEGQTALVVFSGDAFVVTPLTDDAATIKSLLPVLQTNLMPTGGHRADLAVQKGIELLEQGAISQGSILLITAELSSKERDRAIALAAKGAVPVSVLAVATEQGAPIMEEEGSFKKDENGALIVSKLEKENLQALASASEGLYTTISPDERDINTLVKSFLAASDAEQTELKQHEWHDKGYLLVLLALPFFLPFFRRGVLLVLALFFMPSLNGGVWQTPDQEGQELFRQEKWKEASESFSDPDWKATSYYKAGDYQKAAELFTDDYNIGTALAKKGDFQGALASYEKVLEQDPDHEDAAYNKKVIEEYLKQQEEKKQQEQKQDKQDQDQQDKQDQQEENKQDSQDKQDQDKQQQDEKEHDQQDESQEPQDQQTDKQNKPDEEQQKELQDQIDNQLQEQEKEKDQDQELGAAEKGEGQPDPQRQIDDRWLQKIDDDPGGLLRRKFLQQYRERAYKKQDG